MHAISRTILARLFQRAAAPRPVFGPGRSFSLLCLFFLSVFIVSIAAPTRPLAQQTPAWQPAIGDHHAVPGRLIAVDKASQKLFLLERHSPLAATRQFTCSTGKAAGDKSVEGDLKTPEGVYFIVQHIGNGLDFVKYGKEAYTLNYPNPVDRVRQKTGYGIWIHGRGEPIVPMQTEGCVAMINEDLSGMGSVLTPGTPVILTRTFSIKDKAESADEARTAQRLEQRVKDWADAWASRSKAFFDFYDQQAYTIAQREPFSAFRAQKERLFKILPWIKIAVENIHVLEGPGYWVTWFHQDYSAPNLTSKGVRRLYWQKDAKGDFKILGMEWVPGLSTGTLLASAEPALPPLEAAPRTEEQSKITPIIAESGNAVLLAAANRKPRPAAPAVPSSTSGPTLDFVEDPARGVVPEPLLAPYVLILNEDAKRVVDISKVPGQETATPASQGDAKPEKSPAPGKKSPAPGKKPEPEKTSSVKEIPASVSAGSAGRPDTNALPGKPGKKEEPGFTLLTKSLDKALVAAATVPAGPTSQPETVRDKAGSPKTNSHRAGDGSERGKPVVVAVTSSEMAEAAARKGDAKQSGTADAPKPDDKTSSTLNDTLAELSQQVSGSATPDKDADSREQQRTAPSGAPEPEVNDLRVTINIGGTPENAPDSANGKSETRDTDGETAPAVTLITERVQEWGQRWQEADLEAYASFYADKAVQGSRSTRQAIRHQKQSLWSRSKPAMVKLSDIRVTVDGNKATARMVQEYGSTTGMNDVGYKTLEFRRINGVWLITREDWKAQPDG